MTGSPGRPSRSWASAVKEADRCRNFFAMGLVYWLYDRRWTRPCVHRRQVRQARTVAEANGGRSRRAGTTAKHRGVRQQLPVPGQAAPGTYRNITGNQALAWGLIAAASSAARSCSTRLSDHAGQRHPARAVQAQELRRAHLPGRGRDRRDHRGIGAAFGGAMASPPAAARASRSRARRWAWP
jgi:hypothetical protein